MINTYTWHCNNVREKQPSLQYHNFSHVMGVVRTVNDICNEEGLVLHKARAIVAGLYHDVIYLPGANDNEEKSAEYFLSIEPDEYEIADMIKHTSINDHISSDITFENNPYSSALLDADLSSLSCTVFSFMRAQESILFENSKTTEDILLSVNFLNKLREKGFIYRTPSFKSKYEDLAQRNLDWFTYCFSKGN